MTVWSSLRSVGALLVRNDWITCQKLAVSGTTGQRLMSGGHGPKIMPITASRWQWHKFKDLFHYYLMVGLIPVSAIIFYADVFIGPSQLAEIPEGYVPKHWEYQQHPITRFLARYVVQNPQQEYEKYLHYVFEEEEKRQLRFLEKKIKKLMGERNDYKAYYYRPVLAKYVRRHREENDKLAALQGDN